MLDDVELKVLDNLADAWNLYCKLIVQHPDDTRDFVNGIHDCQRIVMARLAVREHPKVFYSPEA